MPTLKDIPMKIVNDAEGAREAEILIYEPIGDNGWGDGLSAKRFAENLKALGKLDKITCRVNSPGGFVSEGMAIFNTLKQCRAEVTMQIDGIAASAASFIVQAASPGRLFMAANALMMIHRAMSLTIGNAEDLRQNADILDKFDETISSTYAARSGRRAETFLKLMAAETWMTADEAIEHKLADAVTPAKKIAACFDLKLLDRFKNTPADIEKRLLEIAENEETGGRPAPDPASTAADEETPEPAGSTDEAVAVRLRLLELDDAN